MNAQITNGNNGGDYIADTAAHKPAGQALPWSLLQCLTDTVLDAATVVNIAGLAASGATLPAGTLIGGLWSSVKLTSGSVILYRNP